MIPERIKPFFVSNDRKDKADVCFATGGLACCNQHGFYIWADGMIQNTFPNKMQLTENTNGLAVCAKCSECGSEVVAFDSECDGYDHCFSEIKRRERSFKTSIKCTQCGESIFLVQLQYEYPNEQELIYLDCTEPDNAFTWIWITLTCTKCGKRFANFVNQETA